MVDEKGPKRTILGAERYEARIKKFVEQDSIYYPGNFFISSCYLPYFTENDSFTESGICPEPKYDQTVYVCTDIVEDDVTEIGLALLWSHPSEKEAESLLRAHELEEYYKQQIVHILQKNGVQEDSINRIQSDFKKLEAECPVRGEINLVNNFIKDLESGKTREKCRSTNRYILGLQKSKDIGEEIHD